MCWPPFLLGSCQWRTTRMNVLRGFRVTRSWLDTCSPGSPNASISWTRRSTVRFSPAFQLGKVKNNLFFKIPLVCAVPRSPLSYLWNLYGTDFVRSRSGSYVLPVCHDSFIRLPWNTFFPMLEDIQLMISVSESYILREDGLRISLWIFSPAECYKILWDLKSCVILKQLIS